MELSYKLSAVTDLQAANWDGILFVGNKNSLQLLPEEMKCTLINAGNADEAFHSSGVQIVRSKGLANVFYSSVGTMNPDYHDIRNFAEAANAGIKRAIKAGAKSMIVALVNHEDYPLSKLVTVLGALEGLYQPIQFREARPEKCPPFARVGIWSKETMNMDHFIRVITALETGRIVARDIGGSDPERMSPPMIEEYVLKAFSGSNISVEVIKSDAVLTKEYPLFSAVNRSAKGVARHAGRIIHLKYEGSNPKETLLLVGKGVTYDTGGADLKVGGVMAGMSRDKCGAAAVAGFLKTVSMLAPNGLRVIGALSLVRNSIGNDCYVSDEIIKSRSGKLVRIGNTDAEGRMIMVDVLNYMKDEALKYDNTHLMTFATLTGHAYLTVGPGYTIAMDNGPARKMEFTRKIQLNGERIGDLMDVSIIRREDFKFNAGKTEWEDLVQANTQPSSRTPRGHQIPGAFLISVSGLDEHGIGSSKPLKYTHFDIAGSAGEYPGIATGSPILALSAQFLNLTC